MKKLAIFSQFKFLSTPNKFRFTVAKNWDFKLDLFLNGDTPKRVYVPHKSSVFSVENLIKAIEKDAKTVEFEGEEGGKIEKAGSFLDLAKKGNLKLSVNSQPISYHLDSFSDLGFFTNSPYDPIFRHHELPFPQSTFFSSFLTAFHSQSSSSEALTGKIFEERLVKSIKSFQEVNAINLKSVENSYHQCLSALKSENLKFQSFEKELAKECQKPLKFLLYLTAIQFVVLFYICYYVYGWDFTEPIGYLISLGIETMAIWYFLKGRGELGQNAIFGQKMSKIKSGAVGRKAKTFEEQKKFLGEKAGIHRRALLFGRF